MIDEKVFDERVKYLFRFQSDMVRERKWKSGKRAGTVKRPKQELPFRKDDLALWLWRKVGIQAIPCPYCNTPIDILSLTLDHRVPRNLGGSLALDNLDPICIDCNNLKSDLTADEFRYFLAWIRAVGTSEHLRANVLKRLRAGAMGLRMRNFGKKATGEPTQAASNLPRYRPPMSQQKAMSFDDF